MPELRLVNRTRETAIDLGVALTPPGGQRIVVGSWDERSELLDGASLLVNTTSLGMKDQPGLDIDLAVSLPGVARADAEALVAKAHQVCPYSNATRGNVDVRLTVV